MAGDPVTREALGGCLSVKSDSLASVTALEAGELAEQNRALLAAPPAGLLPLFTGGGRACLGATVEPLMDSSWGEG